MIRNRKELASGLCLVLQLVLSHHFEPEATDVFLIVCLIIAVWQVLGWKLMSRELSRVLGRRKAYHRINPTK